MGFHPPLIDRSLQLLVFDFINYVPHNTLTATLETHVDYHKQYVMIFHGELIQSEFVQDVQSNLVAPVNLQRN